MKIKLDYEISAQQNADNYYKRAKKLVDKRAGATKAIEKMEHQLSKLNLKIDQKQKETLVTRPKKQIKKEWYEKFHWSFTSDGSMIIAGKDAHQNELLNSKHFSDKDLFFHANIHGAATVLLINGIDSSVDCREETAQFAACYSTAWKEEIRTVDVYAMRREQVSKSTSKGSLGTGSFLLSGEREWYRNMPLGLAAFISDAKFECIALKTYDKIRNNNKSRFVKISLGDDKKSDAAKKIAKMLDYDDIDSIMMQLPNGNFDIKIID